MQPTYLPWSGYFNLIYNTDIFIFLDDAQYSKGSWHNRNLIINNLKKKWITISLKKHKLKTNLNKIYLHDLEEWKIDHVNLLKQSYFKHPFYNSVEEILNFILTVKTNILSELNITLIKFICEKLCIKNKFIQSSHLKVDTQKRTDAGISAFLSIFDFNSATSLISGSMNISVLAVQRMTTLSTFFFIS
jgi:hypothetical protein